MNLILTGILLGIIAGVIDVIPMIIKRLTWDANISAFTMWVVTGFFIAAVNLNIHPVLEGIIIALMVMTPCAVLIGSKEPRTLIPVISMTIILGSMLGFLIPLTAV